jgi:DNA-binding transcriptional MerR regulator
METNTLSIQEVAEATRLSEHTLRYYERIGLIHSIRREDNGHRRYTRDDVGWIDFLMKLKATGMTINDMIHYAELQRCGDETLPERLEMLKTLRSNLEEQIGTLQEHLRLIRFKIDVYTEIVQNMKEKAS